MKTNREKAKGRRESGAFAAIPASVLNHENYKRLSSKAVKLLFDMVAALNYGKGGPKNNGDISIAFSRMEERGWKSKATLRLAELEMTHYRIILKVRHGGTNRCNLNADKW